MQVALTGAGRLGAIGAGIPGRADTNIVLLSPYDREISKAGMALRAPESDFMVCRCEYWLTYMHARLGRDLLSPSWPAHAPH